MLRRRPLLTFALAAVALLLAAHALDRLAYDWLYDPRVYERDWGRMLRVMGFIPVWILAALALALQDGARFGPHGARRTVASGAGQGPSSGAGAVDATAAPHARWGGLVRAAAGRAGFLILAVMASGLVGEVLKLLLRRERPWAAGGAYVFRSFADRPFSGSGLAMPSTHSAVAFGAAFALARLFPRATPVWFLLAAGCAFTRVAARAHFLSDVVLGALVAWAVVAVLRRFWRGRAQALGTVR